MNDRQAYTRIMPRPSRPTQRKLYDPKQEKFVDVPNANESQKSDTKIMRNPQQSIRVVKRNRPMPQKSKDNLGKKNRREGSQNQYRESKNDRPTQPAKGAARVFFRMKTVTPKPPPKAKNEGESKARVVRSVKNRQNRSKGANSKSRRRQQQQQQSGSSDKKGKQSKDSKTKKSNKAATAAEPKKKSETRETRETRAAPEAVAPSERVAGTQLGQSAKGSGCGSS